MIDTATHKRIIYDEISALKYYIPNVCGFAFGFETDYGWHCYIIQEDPRNGQDEILSALAYDTKQELLDELDRRYGKLEEEG